MHTALCITWHPALCLEVQVAILVLLQYSRSSYSRLCDHDGLVNTRYATARRCPKVRDGSYTFKDAFSVHDYTNAQTSHSGYAHV